MSNFPRLGSCCEVYSFHLISSPAVAKKIRQDLGNQVFPFGFAERAAEDTLLRENLNPPRAKGWTAPGPGVARADH